MITVATNMLRRPLTPVAIARARRCAFPASSVCASARWQVFSCPCGELIGVEHVQLFARRGKRLDSCINRLGNNVGEHVGVLPRCIRGLLRGRLARLTRRRRCIIRWRRLHRIILSPMFAGWLTAATVVAMATVLTLP